MTASGRTAYNNVRYGLIDAWWKETVMLMPEEIIRSYLVNPFLYGGGSFCCGCNDYVPEADLFWTETGQNMAEYNQDLKDAYLRVHGEPPPKPVV